MNKYFSRRNACPCCQCATGSELCRTSYNADPLRQYLVSFYSTQGGVDFKYLHDQDYILVECSDCGLIYQLEIPNDFLSHKIYEEWIDSRKVVEHEKNRRIDYYSRICSELIRIIRFLDRPPAELKLLDFSMGWGHWCRVAQSFGCKVHGTELSMSRIDYAKNAGVNVIDHDEIANNSYDFINTEQVFEHLPEPGKTLEYLKSSLKPNGILKISVPNGWDIKKRLKTWNWDSPKGTADSLNPVAPLEHINCFNHSTLLKFSRNCGLTELNIPAEAKTHPNTLRIGRTVKAIFRKLNQIKRIKRIPSGQGTYMFFQAPDAF